MQDVSPGARGYRPNVPSVVILGGGFVIIGAGPTGVELAGALAEISRHALDRDFRNIDPRRARIVLVEALPRVLATHPAELSEKARRQLERLGVEVRTDARVTEIDEVGVSLGEQRMGARMVIWAAGVAASPLARSLVAPLDRAGRVLVNPDLTVPGRDVIFVIGDLAALVQDGRPIPGVASAAIQEGRHAAWAYSYLTYRRGAGLITGLTRPRMLEAHERRLAETA